MSAVDERGFPTILGARLGHPKLAVTGTRFRSGSRNLVARERLANPFGREGGAGERRGRQRDDELLAAPSCDHVARANARTQEPADVGEHGVAPNATTATNVQTASGDLTLQNGFPAATGITNNYAVNPNYRLGYVQIRNLDIQQQIVPLCC